MSDCHLGVRTKRFELHSHKSESGRERFKWTAEVKALDGEAEERGANISTMAKKKSIPHKCKTKKQRLILCFLERTFNCRCNLKERVLGN